MLGHWRNIYQLSASEKYAKLDLKSRQEYLKELSNDNRVEIRESAFYACIDNAKDNQEILEIFKTARKNDNPYIRAVPARYVYCFKNVDNVKELKYQTLSETLKDFDDEVKKVALAEIAEIGNPLKEIEIIKQSLEYDNQELRNAAMRLLLKDYNPNYKTAKNLWNSIPEKERVDFIIKSLKHDNELKTACYEEMYTTEDRKFVNAVANNILHSSDNNLKWTIIKDSRYFLWNSEFKSFLLEALNTNSDNPHLEDVLWEEAKPLLCSFNKEEISRIYRCGFEAYKSMYEPDPNEILSSIGILEDKKLTQEIYDWILMDEDPLIKYRVISSFSCLKDMELKNKLAQNFFNAFSAEKDTNGIRILSQYLETFDNNELRKDIVLSLSENPNIERRINAIWDCVLLEQKDGIEILEKLSMDDSKKVRDEVKKQLEETWIHLLKNEANKEAPFFKGCLKSDDISEYYLSYNKFFNDKLKPIVENVNFINEHSIEDKNFDQIKNVHER